MPFKLPEEVIGEELSIIVGATNTGIVSPLVIEDQVVIDLGNIEVPSKGSVLDYQGVEFELHLPFIADIISVEPVEVVGKVLNIRYLLDIYTGAVSVNLYNGLDYPFFSMSTKVGRSIPFKFFEGTLGSMENIYPVDNRLFSAYLRESRAEVVEGQFNNLVTQTGTLENVSGYVEVEHCELLDVDESSVVVDILKGGVIIR